MPTGKTTANHSRRSSNITLQKKMRSQYQPTGQWIRPEKRLAIYLRDSFKCFYCNADLRKANHNNICLDHIVPRVECHRRGLTSTMNSESNLVTACGACNGSRADMPVNRWIKKMNNKYSSMSRLTKRLSEDLTPYLVNARQIIAKRKR